MLESVEYCGRCSATNLLAFRKYLAVEDAVGIMSYSRFSVVERSIESLLLEIVRDVDKAWHNEQVVSKYRRTVL
jgi:hypothetical protein